MADLARLLVGGTALGSLYALIVLGFVVVYRATDVFNLAQGGLVLLGAYLAYQINEWWHLPFVLTVILTMIVVAIIAVVIEEGTIRPLLGQPLFAVILVTLGVLVVLEEGVVAAWGAGRLNLGDPWGLRSWNLNGVVVELRTLWSIGLSGSMLVAFFLIFHHTRLGLAMRTVAIDTEAAAVQGVNVRFVVAVSWAFCGASAALAGVMAASGVANVHPGIADLALVALPAMVLGGLESPVGAVIGGLMVGIAQTLTAGYQSAIVPFLGEGFYAVMPYVVMVIVLIIRPAGLFGIRQASRA